MIKQDSTIGPNRLAPNKLIQAGKRMTQSVPQMAFNGVVAPKIKRAGINKRISTNPLIKRTFSHMDNVVEFNKEENYMYYDKGMVYFTATPVKKKKKLTDYTPEEFAKLPPEVRQRLLEEAQGEAAGISSDAPILTPEQRRIQQQDRLDREQNLSKVREARGWINTIGNTGREIRSWGNTFNVFGG